MSKIFSARVRIDCKVNFCGACRFRDTFRKKCNLLDLALEVSPRGHLERHAECKQAEMDSHTAAEPRRPLK